MSLDLTITSKTPIIRTGTGVYIRENGETKELKTMEEVRSHFPDADLSNIQVRKYEDYEIFDGNITHNLCEMASKTKGYNRNLYDLFWHPVETKVTQDWINEVLKCCQYLEDNKDTLKPLEERNKITPEHGEPYYWGTYEQLLGFTKKVLDAVLNVDYVNEEYLITADT